MVFFIQKANKILDKKPLIHLDLFQPKSLTILICAKNESPQLTKNLPFILQQKYPDDLLKILVVNDGSSDNSEEILLNLQKEFSQLLILTIPENTTKDLPGKKYALKEGIKIVDTELVLLTDADCSPISEYWAMEMMKTMEKENLDVVLGFGSYENRAGFLNEFIQYETLHTAIQYSSYTLARHAYMGVGRNLLYKSQVIKEVFKDKRLLYKLSQTSSGDDDLIISHLNNYFNIGIANADETYTISSTPNDWKAYYQQKSRHTSSAKYYDFVVKGGLGFYALNHFLSYILPIILLLGALLFSHDFMEILLPVFLFFVLSMLFKYIAYYKWIKVYKTKLTFWQYLKGDVFWVVYNVILSPYIFWKNKQQWN